MSHDETDPIASDIGHGVPGLRDNLRPFSELVNESASQKQVFVQLEGGKYLTGWNAEASTGVYSIALAEVYGDLLHDCVGVETENERLTRVETATLCQDTAGTYYFDPDQLSYGHRWDDGTLWDSGALWEPAALYVHMTGGYSPDDVPTIAKIGFFVGSDTVTQPTFGPEKLTDGGLETWTSTADLTSWTEAYQGSTSGTSLSVETSTGIDGIGSYAAKIYGDTVPLGGYCLAQTNLSVVAGKPYRLSGWYRTDEDNSTGLEARILVGSSDGYIRSDGVGVTTSTAGWMLEPTNGYERRFLFDFIANVSSTTFKAQVGIWNNSHGDLSTTGVWFDGLSFKRVWRYERYESGLDLRAIPQIEEKRTGIFFDPVAWGSGTLSLLNGDGHWDDAVGGLDWINREFKMLAGGRFVGGGNEIPIEDTWTVLAGVITNKISLTDDRLNLPFSDIQEKLAVQLPLNTYDESDYPNLLESELGRRRPMFFGKAQTAKPVCVSTTDWGTYELLDMSNAPAALTGSEKATFRCYLNEDAAAKNDTSRMAALIVTVSTAGQVVMTDCPKVFEITPDNDAFQCDFGGATSTIHLTPGIYTPGQICTLLEAAIDTAAGDSNTTVSISSSTKKYTITRASGTFSINCSESANGRACYGLLGFTGSTDYTGSLSYTSDEAILDDLREAAVRFGGMYAAGVPVGYVDDASGTYTGTASAPIVLAPDIVRCLMINWCGIDSDAIDTASFVAGRSGQTPLSVYIGIPGLELEELPDIIERISNSCGYELLLENGKFYWVERTNATPDNVIDLTEDDYLRFESNYLATDLYKIVRVGYRRDHGSGAYKTTQTTTANVKLRFGRNDQRTFNTAIRGPDLSDATARKDAFVAEASTKRRRFTVDVRGKLFRLGLGRKIRLTRTSGADPSGAISNVLARLLSKRNNAATHETTAELIEVV